MAAPFRLEGLEQLQAKLKLLPKHLKDEIDMELKASALTIEAAAKRDAPKDVGFLANEISSRKTPGVELSYEVISAAFWSAYMEFGTGSKVSIPAGAEEWAAEAKNGGGVKANGISFYESILEWVKRKGLAGTYSVATRRRTGSTDTQDKQNRQVAYLIYRSIFLHGVTPHPFFFKNYFAEKPKLIARIKKIVTDVK